MRSYTSVVSLPLTNPCSPWICAPGTDLAEHRIPVKHRSLAAYALPMPAVPSGLGSPRLAPRPAGSALHRVAVRVHQKRLSPQFFRVSSGWLGGSGSGVVTSSPAAAIWPLVNAWYRSSWFTTSPLEVKVVIWGPGHPLHPSHL